MLFIDLERHVRVAVWSSMKRHDLLPLAQEVFGPWYEKLEFIWHKGKCSEFLGGEWGKPFIRKELSKLEDTSWALYVPDRVLLIDDEPMRCSFNHPGTAVHPITCIADHSGTELRRLARYLKEFVGSDYEAIRDFVLLNPFNELCPVRGTAPLFASRPSPWTRIASRSQRGYAYHFNTETGISQWEPPTASETGEQVTITSETGEQTTMQSSATEASEETSEETSSSLFI